MLIAAAHPGAWIGRDEFVFQERPQHVLHAVPPAAGVAAPRPISVDRSRNVVWRIRHRVVVTVGPVRAVRSIVGGVEPPVRIADDVVARLAYEKPRKSSGTRACAGLGRSALLQEWWRGGQADRVEELLLAVQDDRVRVAVRQGWEGLDVLRDVLRCRASRCRQLGPHGADRDVLGDDEPWSTT